MESIVKINDKLDLIPSHLQLSAVEKMLVNAYFLINSLVASDYIIIPCEPSYFSIAGVQLMLDTVEEIKESNLNPKLKVLGFIFNKYSKQSNIHKRG